MGEGTNEKSSSPLDTNNAQTFQIWGWGNGPPKCWEKARAVNEMQFKIEIMLTTPFFSAHLENCSLIRAVYIQDEFRALR